MMHSLIDLVHCIQTRRIEHEDYAEGRKILHEIWDYTNQGLSMNAVAIIGGPGTGKTSLVKSLIHEHPPSRATEGMHIPIAYVKLPYAPTIKSTLGAILTALGDPIPMKGTIEDRMYRVHVLIRQCGTKIIIFDEYQRLIEWATKRKINDVFEMLKDLMSPDLGIVIAGLPSCADVIRDNLQIKRRLLASVNLKPFSIDTKANFLRFKGVLQIYNKMISAYLDIPQLDSSSLVERFYCATGGLIAYVNKILEFAVLQAHRKNLNTINLDDLAYARKKVVFDHNIWASYGEPFSEEFNIETIPNYAHIATQICIDDPHFVPRKPRKETVSEMVTKR